MTTTRRASARVAVVLLCILGLACRPSVRSSAGEATAGIDSLNAALVRAYRTHDPQAYAALYTDTAVFEWPAFNTVRGPAQLAAMARSSWASLRWRGATGRRSRTWTSVSPSRRDASRRITRRSSAPSSNPGATRAACAGRSSGGTSPSCCGRRMAAGGWTASSDSRTRLGRTGRSPCRAQPQ